MTKTNTSKGKKHKHNWQFVEKTGFNRLSTPTRAEFICECGKTKLVRIDEQK